MTGMQKKDVSAAQFGLASCHTCNLVVPVHAGDDEELCPRCGSHLHLRKPNSIGRSWAFLIASYILYVPANVMPIMHTNSLFGGQSDTIMSGVIYLWTSGSWYLAVIVFIASILVPSTKLLAITFLLISVQRRSLWDPMQRNKMYRIVELVGRWSMLDIFVVAIRAGLGAVAFGAVVVLTMFAAMEFDPRLIWDPIRGIRRESHAR
jgi:paraquat-inducible protein A